MMNSDAWKLLTWAVGETIDSVRARGGGGWAIVTRSLIIHVRHIVDAEGLPLDGHVIAAIEKQEPSDHWLLHLSGGHAVTLREVEAVMRGHTPIEGVPIVTDSRHRRN